MTGLLFVLGLNKSISQDQSSQSITAIERHKMGVESVEITAEFFETRMFINNRNDTLLYRLLKPFNYDSSKKHPLVLCLSGVGGRGNDNITQIAGCWPAQILSNNENRKRYPAFLFVPQCPNKSHWGAEDLDKSPSNVDVESLVFEVISELEVEFNIDTTRRYVTGQSMGGFGTWHYILTKPQMFAAAIPVCGGGNPELVHNIIDVPVWAFHGQKDKIVPVENSRDMIDAIIKAGGNPRYNEFTDADHVSWPLAFDTPGLLAWIFNQKKGK
jgi:predicted peptidase